MIGMNDFGKEYADLRRSLIPKLQSFFASGNYILGPEVEAFERDFSSFVGTKYCIGVANGLEAIQIVLWGLGVGSGDEVITVSNSDVATALAILFVGATPVFVDVDKYFHMDPSLIEQAITGRTKVILPIHLFGQTADMDAITKIAKKHHLFIVEDACQAHGAALRGKKAGTFGAAGCFSFYPTKNLGAAGDAGAIVTSSTVLYRKFAMLRNRGASKRSVHPLRGLNSRLDELQAVILRNKLYRLKAFNRRRAQIASRYAKLLNGVSEVALPLIRNPADHVFHQYVIRAAKRNALQEYLRKNGVTTLVHYPIPIHKQRSFSEFRHTLLPFTERLAKEILSLPIHPYMTDNQVDTVACLVRHFYQHTQK